jgi:hypothetical protein
VAVGAFHELGELAYWPGRQTADGRPQQRNACKKNAFGRTAWPEATISVLKLKPSFD